MDRELLRAEVLSCIAAGKEGEWWDFKAEWHTSMKELVKDIVCFANTAHNRDCYLIIGVSDDRRIVGMTKPRRKQADILEALTHVPFAGAYLPKIEVYTFLIEEKEVDVLVICNTDMTPIYLDANYGPMDKACIYVRTGDKNTASHSNADIHDIEMLWRKRFGLTKAPLDYALEQMADPTLWGKGEKGYYHRFKPEYTLTGSSASGPDTPLALTQDSPSLSHEKLILRMGQTTLMEFSVLSLNAGQLMIPTPQTASLGEGEYLYYLKDSPQYKLLAFLHPSPTKDWEKVLEPILSFADADEKDHFETWMQGRKDQVLQRYINEARYLRSEPTRLADKLRLYLVIADFLREYQGI